MHTHCVNLLFLRRKHQDSFSCAKYLLEEILLRENGWGETQLVNFDTVIQFIPYEDREQEKGLKCKNHTTAQFQASSWRIFKLKSPDGDVLYLKRTGLHALS